MLVAAFTFATLSFAQETAVKTSKVFDNTFVSLNGGATWSLSHPTLFLMKDVHPLAQFAFGKYYTPVIGNQLFLEGGMNEGNKTFFDHMAFGADWLVNLNNLFAGYNGKPRIFEIVAFAGAGAFHVCGAPDGQGISSINGVGESGKMFEVGTSMNHAAVTNTWSSLVRGGIQFNFNIGKERTWQFNVVPSFTYLPRRCIGYSYVGVQAGFTYKFKNSFGTHNFVLAKLLNEDEWNRLNADVNSLRAQNEQLAQTVNTQATTIKELTERLNNLNGKLKLNNVVNFKIGSSTVEPLQMGNLAKVADALNANKDAKVNIRGFADAQTGSAKFNQTLSEKRAQAVKDVLVNTFNVNVDQVTTEGVGSTQQVFNQNDWNRVAIFVTK